MVLILVGVGDGKSEIEDKVRKLGLKDKVIFLGGRNDIPDVLQALDVFVFPSLYEGLGIAAVEAASSWVTMHTFRSDSPRCRLTENVEVLSLKDSPLEWANHILAYGGSEKKNEFSANM